MSSARMKKLEITNDDSKVLGKSPTRFLRKSDSNFTTSKFQTYNSAWTPIIHKPSNEQIYKERRELISHWFDLWTDAQRKRFLDVIFKKCGRSQLHFAHNWFEARAIIERVDPIAVLPRFLTLYIFSYLNAKNLSRASQVSWSWKFAADQDALWRTKCEKFGWYLPYKPTETEYGCWKKHYTQCVLNMDVVLPMDQMYKTLTDAQKMISRHEDYQLSRDDDDKGYRVKPLPISSEASQEIMRSRPPWHGPSKSARDLQDANKALLYGFNPNEPAVTADSTLFHNQFGQLNPRARAKTSPGRSFTQTGLSSQLRKSHHRTLSAGSEPADKMKKTLSSVTIRRYQKAVEKSLTELKSRPWEPVANRSRVTIKDSNSYSLSSTNRRQVKVKNPRIVFISSRVPASEMLHDAVLNQVYPILYEYEGTTVENLIDRLAGVLEGQRASSIGLVVHSSEPGELCLLRDLTTVLDNLDEDRTVWFFQSLANHTQDVKEGGRIDVFSPLAASESGTEMLVQLNLLTGHKFAAPTGISGQNTKWECDWFGLNSTPVHQYFESSKCNIWSLTAQTVLDAIMNTREQLQPYFDQTRKDVLSQLTGQIMGDSLALGHVHGLTRVAPVISNALAELGASADSKVDPVKFVGDFLLGTVGGLPSLSSMMRTDTMQENTMKDDDTEKQDSMKDDKLMLNDSQSDTFMTNGKFAAQTVGLSQATRSNMRRTGAYTSSLNTTAQVEYSDHPDRRFIIAKEFLSTEIIYNNDLGAVRKIFVLPLKRSIESNRAVIASSTVQQLFSDITIIEELHQELLNDLKPRVRQWNSDSCLGELFIKFSSKLAAYINYISRYPTILLTYDREIDVNPGFRAFLRRQEKTPSTRMKSLHELYLTPTERIVEYVRLLTWLRANTSRDSPDRQDLGIALNQIKEVDRVIRQTRSRIRRDRVLMGIQKQILGCPQLLESNRVFITKQNFSMMIVKDSKTASLPHENRMYVHVKDIGLYLFSDALVLTHITTEHHAYERSIAQTYNFICSLALPSVSVKDITDTRYIQNAFRIKCGTEEWMLASSDHDEKFDILSTLQSAIKSAIKDFEE